MAYLLRKLSNIDAWAEAADSPLWASGDCPPEILRQVYDNSSGVSTWRVETRPEVERAVAAQTFLRSSIGNFSYCLINEGDLAVCGIKTVTKPGKTVDSEINQRHVELTDMTALQIVSLARLILDKCEPDVITREEIMQTAATHFDNGKFELAYLFKGGKNGRTEVEIANSRELLVNLWKRRDLKIST